MSEAGAETIQKSPQQIAREKWGPYMAANPDPDFRSTVQGMIFAGISPTEGISEQQQKEQIERVSRIRVKNRFEELNKMLAPVTGEERRAFDIKTDEIIEEIMAESKEHFKGGSVAPGAALKRVDEEWIYPPEKEEEKHSRGEEITTADRIDEIKADWREYSAEWTNEGIKEVAHKIDGLGFGLECNQINVLLEMLIATGQTPQEIISEIEQTSMRDIAGSPEFEELQHAYRQEKPRDIQKLLFFKEIGIAGELGEKYLRRFVFNEEFRVHNDYDYDAYPSNVEELAWQIIYSPEGTHDKMGVFGKFPLLEMRLEKDEETGRAKGKYYISQRNMNRWVRDRMMHAYDNDPDVAQNYFANVRITKKFPVSLQDMFGSPGNYFKSEDGKTEYNELYEQWIKEAWALQTLRSWDAAYMKERGNGEELMKVYTAIFGENTLFKASFGKNLFSLMTSLSLDFEGPEPGKLPQNDILLGAAWNDIYLAYDSISDYESLQKILGSGSSFFTRKGFDDAFKYGVLIKKIKASGESTPRAILIGEEQESYEKAFDENGLIRDKKAFIELINIYSQKLINPNLQFTVREMLKAAIAEKYGGGRDEGGESYLKTKDGKEDGRSLDMAEVFAWSLVRVMGGEARNDTKGRAHSYLSKLFNTRIWRRKTIDRGDALGNRQTLEQIKATAVDPMRGILTLSEAPLLDENGIPKKDSKGKLIMQRKPVIQVMQELNQVASSSYSRRRVLQKEADEAAAKGDRDTQAQRQADIAQLDLEISERYQNKAGELEFKQIALQNYREDHLSMGHDLYNLIKGGEEIEWEKFTRYDMFAGAHFKTEEFQKEVQEKMLHKIRYLLETYPDLNFNMIVRTLDQAATFAKGEPVYRDMTIAEMMFGHGMLNRADFWARDSKNKPIPVYDNKGKRIKGVFEIDYDKVNEKPQLIWKQWFMTKIAADLLRHRKLYLHDERFNFTYYQNAVNALIKIPGKIMSDEYGLQRVIETEPFFSKADIAWLRREAKVETFDLYWKAGASDLLKPKDPEEGIGLFLGLSLLMRTIVKQGS